MERQIARVKAGRFEAWFDIDYELVPEGEYAIMWSKDGESTIATFSDEKAARNFWHKEVIDQYNFQYCYCCK